jgi:hypothetical protein
VAARASTATRSSQGAGEQTVEAFDGAARDEHRVRSPARTIERSSATGVDEGQRRRVDDDHVRAEQTGRVHCVHHRFGGPGVELASNVHDDNTVRPAYLDL